LNEGPFSSCRSIYRRDCDPFSYFYPNRNGARSSSNAASFYFPISQFVFFSERIFSRTLIAIFVRLFPRSFIDEHLCLKGFPLPAAVKSPFFLFLRSISQSFFSFGTNASLVLETLFCGLFFPSFLSGTLSRSTALRGARWCMTEPHMVTLLFLSKSLPATLRSLQHCSLQPSLFFPGPLSDCPEPQLSNFAVAVLCIAVSRRPCAWPRSLFLPSPISGTSGPRCGESSSCNFL